MSTDTKRLIGIGVVATILGGIVLLKIEYGVFSTQAIESPVGRVLGGSTRSVRLSTTLEGDSKRFLRRTRYWRTFEIELAGGNVGFPPSTSIQMSTSTGGIYSVSCPEAIRPRFGDDVPAVRWSDQDYSAGIRAVFVDGPNPGVVATIVVAVVSTDGRIPEDALTVLASVPGVGPVPVEFIETNK